MAKKKKKKKKVRGKGNKGHLLAGGGFLDAAGSALQKKDSSAKKQIYGGFIQPLWGLR